MELIELLVIFFAWLSGNKSKPEDRGNRRVHPIEPGTDLEGARPKLDRYGLDHAVPVLVYDVGPDTLVQPARRRAGDKRRLIEQRLATEQGVRDDSAAAGRVRPDENAENAYRTEDDEPNAKYPYAFQAQARATRHGDKPPAHPIHVAAATSPIRHRAIAGDNAQRRTRRKDAGRRVAAMLNSPKMLADVVKAKLILDPPPALRGFPEIDG